MKIGLFEIALIGGGLWLWSKSQEGKAPGEIVQKPSYWASWPGATMAINAAIADASRRFPRPQTSVAGDTAPSLRSIIQVEWPNASLGVPEPGRVYASVSIPGYKITLNDWGHFPEYHADRNGRVVYAGG